MHPLVTIILAAVGSSVEQFLGMGLGILLSHPKYGILADPTVKAGLSRLTVKVLIPVFHIKNFGSSLNVGMMSSVWLLPLLGTGQNIAGMIFTELLVFNPLIYYKVPGCIERMWKRLKKWVKRDSSSTVDIRRKSLRLQKIETDKNRLTKRMMYSLSAAFGNGGFYPMLYIGSLVSNSKIFDLEKPEETALSLISLWILLRPVAFFSFFLNYIEFVKRLEDKRIEARTINIQKEEIELPTVKIPHDADTSGTSDEEDSPGEKEEEEGGESTTEDSTEEEEEESEEGEEEEEESTENSSTEENEDEEFDPSESSKSKRKKEWEKWKKRLLRFWQIFRKIVGNNILAIVTGMTIGLIAPLRNFIFTNPPIVFSSVTKVILRVANIPLGLNLIIVGSNIGKVIWERWYEEEEGEQEGQVEEEEEVGEKKSRVKTFFAKCWNIVRLRHVEVPALALILATRFVLFPIVSFLFMLFLVNVGNLSSILFPDDKLRGLILLIISVEGAVPMMLTLNLISGMLNIATDAMSEVMLIQYLLAPFTMWLWTVIALYYVCGIEKCLI